MHSLCALLSCVVLKQTKGDFRCFVFVISRTLFPSTGKDELIKTIEIYMLKYFY